LYFVFLFEYLRKSYSCDFSLEVLLEKNTNKNKPRN